MIPSSLESFRPKICKKSLLSVSDSQQNYQDLLFVFKITYDSIKTYTWLIKKKSSDFFKLVRDLEKEVSQGNLSSLPVFPPSNNFQSLSHESKFLLFETYLISLQNLKEICLNPKFWEFLEVSALSFDGTSNKRKEGYVMKRTGGRINNEKLCCNLSKHFKRLQKRWVVIKDNMIGYLSNHTREILHEVLMFKGKFEVKSGVQDTGFDDGVMVITNRRNFLFRAGNLIEMNEWVNAIQEAYNESEWRNPDVRFESSFPPRSQNISTWFVDGEEYFSEVLSSLQQAQREVFISDWWLSPELFLKRPSIFFPESSIIEVLGQLADRGISVYVHIYKEVSLALTLNSLHTKKTLINRNPKIKVVRHPHRSVVGSQFLWSHHEKIICIDQEIAFIGGLDLCFGRMDSKVHQLTDNVEPYIWNGIDYSNVRIADFTSVEQYYRDSIDRNNTPRMPWHDIAIKIVGKAAGDISLHFIELWNHIMTDISSDYWKNKDLIQPNTKTQKTEPVQYDTLLKYNFPESPKATMFETKRETSKSFKQSRKLSMLSNSFSKRIDAFGLDHLIEDAEEISPSPLKLLNNESRAWFSKESRVFGGLRSSVSRSMKKDDLEELDELLFKNELEADIEQGDEFWAKNLLLPKTDKLKYTGTTNCQIVRSAGPWSLGLDKPEHSIHSAYLHMIDEANHFIYIENQFFISSTAGKPVRNNIAMALLERIKIAASERENFKVIVLMPLLPGFEGKIESSSILKAQLHWEYSTICRGIASIIEQLKNDPNIVTPDDYISFYSLRNHGDLNGKPVTEMIYIHSKLMIVDDETVIIGSANINDRSMLGQRDSEIAVVVNDEKKVESVIDGNKVMVSEFAYTLRMRLFKEFTDCEDEEILRDPLSENFKNLWKTSSENNTVLYRHIFKCVPDDSITRVDHVENFEKESNLHDYNKLKHCFKGFLVDFPLNFLKEESLKISIFNKEYLLPEENFV